VAGSKFTEGSISVIFLFLPLSRAEWAQTSRVIRAHAERLLTLRDIVNNKDQLMIVVAIENLDVTPASAIRREILPS